MERYLEGKVAIVTGSGQGIGKGVARYLAMAGCKVVTNNRKPGSGTLRTYKKEEMPEEDWELMTSLAGDAAMAAEVIKGEGGEAVPFFGDVSDWETARKMIEFTMETYGRIDILVNNAGGTGNGSIVDLTEPQFDALISKIKGSFNLMHFAVPHMIKQGFGRIFNVSSEAWIGLPGNTGYSAGNAGVIGLAWAAGKELYRHGITVNAICPQGESPAHAVSYRQLVRNVERDAGKKPDPEFLKTIEENHGDPRGVGAILAYLCTEDAGYISGNVFALYASGVVKLYSNPDYIATITKEPDEQYFDKDELKTKFRELLGADYQAPSSMQMW